MTESNDRKAERAKLSSPSEDGSLDDVCVNMSDVPDDNPSLNLSFAGCGFLGIYHLGVASTFQKHGRLLLEDVTRYTGASAGALVASVLAIKGCEQKVMEDCIEFTYNAAKDVYHKRLGLLTPGYSILDSLHAFLESQLPEDAHVTATGRLYISMTSSGFRKNHMVSEYESKEDLIQCLLASSYLPHITGKKPITCKGKKYIDGGLSDNLPLLSCGRTVCVTPFSGRYDVCPADGNPSAHYLNINKQDFQVNYKNIVRGIHAFFPPKPAQLESYFYKGVRDAIAFLKRENKYTDESEGSQDECDGEETKEKNSLRDSPSQSEKPPPVIQYESCL